MIYPEKAIISAPGCLSGDGKEEHYCRKEVIPMPNKKEAAKMIILFANEMIKDALYLSEASSEDNISELLSKVEKDSLELSELLALAKKK